MELELELKRSELLCMLSQFIHSRLLPVELPELLLFCFNHSEFSGNVIFTLRCQADEVTYNCSFENDSAELGTTLNNLCACYNTPSSCVRILQSCLILPSNSSTTIPLPSSTCTTSIPFNSDDINFGTYKITIIVKINFIT